METEDKKSKIPAEPVDNETSMETFHDIQQMSVMEKVKLASLGNKEIRRILIRDGAKTVQVAVINNPKITDDEIQQIASSRSIESEVLRIILTNREWIKNYKIKLTLVKNPKTPLQAAMKMITQLRVNDLKQIMGSRGIPNPLRAAAKRLYEQRIS
jgi:hypothetical protein